VLVACQAGFETGRLAWPHPAGCKQCSARPVVSAWLTTAVDGNVKLFGQRRGMVEHVGAGCGSDRVQGLLKNPVSDSVYVAVGAGQQAVRDESSLASAGNIITHAEQ